MNRAGPAVTTVAEALNRAAAALDLAGVAQPRLDARLLLAHALGVGSERTLGEPKRRIHAGAVRRLEGLTARRARREPVARLIGRREFWSLSFRVTPDTLDPRPDSETVVEGALAALDAAGLDRGREFRLLDLGTGTGCLLLALLRELPEAHGIGVDIVPGACATAAANAKSLGLGRRAGFVVGDWGRGLAGGFDLIVANPPYIPDRQIEWLQPEVARYAPRPALAGGADGLECYRALAPDLARLLSDGGLAAVELGAGQAGAVNTIFTRSGLDCQRIGRDLSAIERCIVLGRTSE